MILVSIPQKDVVLSFFQDDIKLVKKHFMAIDFDFDDSFKYDTFKEFLYSAAGMFKELDMQIYNKELVVKFQLIREFDKNYTEFLKKSTHSLDIYQKNFLNAQESYKEKKDLFEILKAELQLLIIKELELYKQKGIYEEQLEKKTFANEDSKKEFIKKLKGVRKSHVDVVHILGSQRNRLSELSEVLTDFEKSQKKEFLDYFKSVKDKLDFQYKQTLNFYAFEFNKSLFKNSKRSSEINKFKQECNIVGDFDLCKYVEYYLKNVNPDIMSDEAHKKRLQDARSYCKNLRERANLF